MNKCKCKGIVHPKMKILFLMKSESWITPPYASKGLKQTNKNNNFIQLLISFTVGLELVHADEDERKSYSEDERKSYGLKQYEGE